MSQTTNVAICLYNYYDWVLLSLNWKSEVVSMWTQLIVQASSRWQEVMKKMRGVRGDIFIISLVPRVTASSIQKMRTGYTYAQAKFNKTKK